MTKKLNILLITEYLPPQINGIATRCSNLIKNFRKLGHTVYIAGPDNSPQTTISMFTIPNFLVNKDNKLCFLDIPSTTSIIQLIPTLDIVHVFYPINFTSSILFPLFKLNNIPVICSHHCEVSQINYFYKNYNKKMMYNLLKMYHLQFNHPVVSLNLVPSITEEYKKFFDNLSIIPSGFDNKTFNHCGIDLIKKCSCKLLVYVGRLSPEKNCDKMLIFFEKLIQNPKFRKYKLLVIGDGPSKIELKNKKISNVSFIGYVEHNKVSEYYKIAQAFITFSLTESFGFTNIEALACATPIIYPKCDVFDTYYKKDFSDTCFDVNNYDSFEKAVKYTYKNTTVQKKAIEYCKDKNWKSATKKLINIYCSEIKKKNIE